MSPKIRTCCRFRICSANNSTHDSNAIKSFGCSSGLEQNSLHVQRVDATNCDRFYLLLDCCQILQNCTSTLDSNDRFCIFFTARWSVIRYQQRSMPAYVGVAKTVPIPRYDAPAVTAARASDIELHVMPMIACSPSIFRAVVISMYRVSQDLIARL